MNTLPLKPAIELKNYLDLMIDVRADKIGNCPVCIDGISTILQEIHTDLKEKAQGNIQKMLETYGVKSGFYNWKVGRYPVPIAKIKKILEMECEICQKTNKEKEELYDRIFRKATFFRSFKTNVKIRVVKELTPRLAYLLGVLYADGSLRDTWNTYQKEGRFRYEITITDESKEHLENVRMLLDEEFNIKTNVKTVYNRWHRLLFYSGSLHRMLSKVFEMPIGYKKGKLKVPDIINNAPDEIKKYFIMGFFDGDGSCTKIKKQKKISPIIHVSQSDPKILIEIQNLLKNFELDFKLHKKRREKFVWYMLETKSKTTIKKYSQIIGFLHPDKKARLDWLVQRLD